MSRRTEVCREFLRGSCRFGTRCKFLHDTAQQQQNQLSSPFSFGVKNQGPSQHATSNRGGNYYSPLASSQRQQQKGPSQVPVKEHRCTDPKDCSLQIKEDLANEQPNWRLTCYAHGKYLPNDIVGDISFEELRAQAYAGALQGMSLENMVQSERNTLVAKKKEFEQLGKSPYSGPASSSSSTFSQPAFSSSTTTPDPARMSFGTATQPSPFGPAPPHVFSEPRRLVGTANARESGGFSFGLGGAAPQNANTVASPPTLFPSQSAPAPKGFSFGVQSFVPGPSVPPASSPQSAFGSVFQAFGQETKHMNHNVAHSTAQAFFGSTQPAQAVEMREASNNVQSHHTVEAAMKELARDISSQIVSSLPSPSTGNADIWLKESWTLGEIPEEEPPIYAR